MGLFSATGLSNNLNVTNPIADSRRGNDIGTQEKVKTLKAYGKLPIYFIPNEGQMNGQVKHYTACIITGCLVSEIVSNCWLVITTVRATIKL